MPRSRHAWSGSRYALLHSGPLGTVHASFDAHGSSLCEGTFRYPVSQRYFEGVTDFYGNWDGAVMVAVRTRTLHGGVDQKRETTPVLQNCSVLAVDGIDGRYRVRRKEPEGRVQTHQARRVSGGGDAGVWMR
jgi:hypothetical protein